ncbi:Leucine-rich repeat-containing protein 43 [Dinochytrium kinnereticum]|nr:Leucine-rich repeat-containing protein 43 [Dinochytrium kinnereticum]
MVTLSQAFLDLLNRDLGIIPSRTPILPPTIPILSNQSKLKPLPAKRNVVSPAPTTPMGKVKNRTDSAFNTVALHVPRVPLTLADLEDEDAEGVFEDCFLDGGRQALDWSDEAQNLRHIKHISDRKSKLLIHRHLAEINKQLHELLLRGQQPSTSTTQLTTAKQTLEDMADNAQGSFTEEFLFEFFKTLRLVGLGIGEVDAGVERLRNVRELSVTGNFIERLCNLPEDIHILHANANCLTACPNLSHLKKLVHIGCGYNCISSMRCNDPVLDDPYLWFPDSLVSLDLSGNNLVDIDETVGTLENARNLKILSLLKNPISLLKVYRTTIVSRLWKLISLDEVSVTNFERAALARKKFGESEKTSIKLLLHLQEMTSLKQPEIEATDEKPADEVRYFIHVSFEKHPDFQFSSVALPWQEELMDFKDETSIDAVVSKEFRDAVESGLMLRLFEQRHTYVFKNQENKEGENDYGTLAAPEQPTGSRPGSGLKKSEAKPASATPAKPPPPSAPKKTDKKKPNPNQKNKKVVDDEVLFSKVLAYEKEIGKTLVSLAELFAGQSEVCGDYPFEIITADSKMQTTAIVRLILSLNPTLDAVPSEGLRITHFEISQ